LNRALVLITISIFFLSYAHYLPGASTASGAPAIEWSKTYARATSYVFEGLPYLVRQTADGGYAIAGSTDKVQPGIWHFWLIKTDSNGIVQWNKTYGGPERDRLWSFVQTSDGGFALIGDEPDVGLALLVKVDLNGNVEWNKTLGTTNGDTIHSITETVDGGYAMAGITNGAGYDGILMKSDSAGNMQWYKTYGGASNDQFESVVQSSDGGYAMAGATQSFDSSGKTKAYFVKTDSGGNMQWNKTYSRTAGHDYGRTMIQTSEGGYAIAGQTDFFGSGDAWLMKTDVTGNLVWDKTYDKKNADGAGSIVQTREGGYAIAGQTDFWGNGDTWLIKADSNGNTAWNETFGGAGYDRGCSVIQTDDNGYAVAGYTNSFSGDGSYQVWLIKLGGSGPRTWVVDDDGPADFNTIQAAINAASDGDTVFVKAGAYSEPIQINKALTLLGENKSKTFIKDWYIGVYANNVRISNFTIKNLWADSPSGAGGCVYIYGFDGLTFSDNIYIHNWQAIRLIQTSGDLIINNYIDGSSQGGTLGGIGFDYANNTIMRNNTLTNCGQALSLSLPNYNNTFLENNITGNSFGIVMNNLLTGNRFYHNNVVNNNEQVYTYYIFQGVDNSWDDGYPSGGNYWSDYVGTDANSDGIGDTPYVINPYNLDRYPLMNPWNPVYMCDGFESGNFSRWTSTQLSSGEIATVTKTLPHHGTYSARFASNGTGGTEWAYCYENIVNSRELYVRAYFYVSTSGIAQNGDRICLMQLNAGGSNINVAYAGWRNVSGVVKWYLSIRNGSSLLYADSASTPALNTWYCVELHWKKDVVNGQGDMWINGAKTCSISGKNTAFYGDVTTVRFGLAAVYYCGPTTAYCDCVRMSTAYIDPEPVVTSLAISANPFSPNGDGSKDNTTIKAAFNVAVNWNLQIRNSSGTTLRTWTGTGTSLSVLWNGLNSTGFRVPDGTYTVRLSGTDLLGVTFTTKSATVTVDTKPPAVTGISVSPTSFNPQLGQTTRMNYTLSENCYVTTTVYNSTGALKRTLSNGVLQTGGLNSIIWNGKDSLNSIVPLGTYTIKIYVVDKAGNKATPYPITQTATVDTKPPAVTSVSVTPSSFKPTVGETARINYTLSESCYVTIKIYNSTGTLKRTLLNGVLQASGLNSIVWNGRDSSNIIVSLGTYTIKIYVTDKAGNRATSYPIVKTVTVSKI